MGKPEFKVHHRWHPQLHRLCSHPWCPCLARTAPSCPGRWWHHFHSPAPVPWLPAAGTGHPQWPSPPAATEWRGAQVRVFGRLWEVGKGPLGRDSSGNWLRPWHPMKTQGKEVDGSSQGSSKVVAGQLPLPSGGAKRALGLVEERPWVAPTCLQWDVCYGQGRKRGWRYPPDRVITRINTCKAFRMVPSMWKCCVSNGWIHEYIEKLGRFLKSLLNLKTWNTFWATLDLSDLPTLIARWLSNTL